MSQSKKVQGFAFGILMGVCSLAAVNVASADTRIERQGSVYVVAENEAAGVCKAVVRDQPGQLRTALYHSVSPIERHRAHTYYQCNDKNLLSFAKEVNANKVAAYLTPKFESNQVITTEEVASR